MPEKNRQNLVESEHSQLGGVDELIADLSERFIEKYLPSEKWDADPHKDLQSLVQLLPPDGLQELKTSLQGIVSLVQAKDSEISKHYPELDEVSIKAVLSEIGEYQSEKSSLIIQPTSKEKRNLKSLLKRRIKSAQETLRDAEGQQRKDLNQYIARLEGSIGNMESEYHAINQNVDSLTRELKRIQSTTSNIMPNSKESKTGPEKRAEKFKLSIENATGKMSETDLLDFEERLVAVSAAWKRGGKSDSMVVDFLKEYPDFNSLDLVKDLVIYVNKELDEVDYRADNEFKNRKPSKPLGEHSKRDIVQAEAFGVSIEEFGRRRQEVLDRIEAGEIAGDLLLEIEDAKKNYGMKAKEAAMLTMFVQDGVKAEQPKPQPDPAELVLAVPQKSEKTNRQKFGRKMWEPGMKEDESPAEAETNNETKEEVEREQVAKYGATKQFFSDMWNYHVKGETGEKYKRMVDGEFERDEKGELVLEHRALAAKSIIFLSTLAANSAGYLTGSKAFFEAGFAATQNISQSKELKKVSEAMRAMMDEMIAQKLKHKDIKWFTDKSNLEEALKMGSLSLEDGVKQKDGSMDAALLEDRIYTLVENGVDFSVLSVKDKEIAKKVIEQFKGADSLPDEFKEKLDAVRFDFVDEALAKEFEISEKELSLLDIEVKRKIQGIIEGNATMPLERQKLVRERLQEVVQRRIIEEQKAQKSLEEEVGVLLNAAQDRRKNLRSVIKESINTAMFWGSAAIPGGGALGWAAGLASNRLMRTAVFAGFSTVEDRLRQFKVDTLKEGISNKEVESQRVNGWFAGRALIDYTKRLAGREGAADMGRAWSKLAIPFVSSVLLKEVGSLGIEKLGDMSDAIKGMFEDGDVPEISDASKTLKDLSELSGGRSGGVGFSRELSPELEAIRLARAASPEGFDVDVSSFDRGTMQLDGRDLVLVGGDKQHYGITQVLALQFAENPSEWGYDAASGQDVDDWAVEQALEQARGGNDWIDGEGQTHMTTAAKGRIAIIPRHTGGPENLKSPGGYTFFDTQTGEALSRQEMYDQGFAEGVLGAELGGSGPSTSVDVVPSVDSPSESPEPQASAPITPAAPQTPQFPVRAISHMSGEPLPGDLYPVGQGPQETPGASEPTAAGPSSPDEVSAPQAEQSADTAPTIDSEPPSVESSVESAPWLSTLSRTPQLSEYGYRSLILDSADGGETLLLKNPELLELPTDRPGEAAVFESFSSRIQGQGTPENQQMARELFTYVRMLIELKADNQQDGSIFEGLVRGYLAKASEFKELGFDPNFLTDGKLSRIKEVIDEQAREIRQEAI